MTNDGGNDGNGQLILDSRTKTKKPSMYKVIMINDDYTTMEFVVHVLQKFFGRSSGEGVPRQHPLLSAAHRAIGDNQRSLWRASGAGRARAGGSTPTCRP